MSVVPPVTPVTVPLATVTFALDADQVPPVVDEATVAVAPTHTDDAPVMLAGSVLTVSTAVAVQPAPSE